MSGAVMDQAFGANWALYNGDSAEVLRSFPSDSVGHACFSPPFSSIYTYSPNERDLGNVRSHEEFFQHFGFISRELLRVLMPGRVVAMHTYEIQQYGTTNDGVRNRYDFPGDCLRQMEQAGFWYRGRITIDKNPQTAAIRNHPQELNFSTLRRDAAKLAVGQADYILIFLKPGANPEPVVEPITEDVWVQWARPVWTDIREMDILPDAGSKDNDDERHLCPLQLPVIERCIRLWSNPGDTILDPFAGIGSTGVVALRQKRRFAGIELKPAYWKVACGFLREAEMSSRSLFDLMAEATA